MRFWTSQSISDKLMRMTLLVGGVSLLLAYVSFLIYDIYSLRQQLMSSMATEASIVGANSVTALLFDDKQAAENTLSALRKRGSEAVQLRSPPWSGRARAVPGLLTDPDDGVYPSSRTESTSRSTSSAPSACPFTSPS